MVRDSSFSRRHLKKRLYQEGLKQRRCEMCGPDEDWRGSTLALILDHINGVANDNRLENLRIICPNCAATLETHCGRHNRRKLFPVPCRTCEVEFTPKYSGQQSCSIGCWWASEQIRVPRHQLRKVERPPHDVLMRELADTSYVAVGRKYGVSDNAIRKWVRWYEGEAARTAG